jgi:hypothetical protein
MVPFRIDVFTVNIYYIKKYNLNNSQNIYKQDIFFLYIYIYIFFFLITCTPSEHKRTKLSYVVMRQKMNRTRTIKSII